MRSYGTPGCSFSAQCVAPRFFFLAGAQEVLDDDGLRMDGNGGTTALNTDTDDGNPAYGNFLEIESAPLTNPPVWAVVQQQVASQARTTNIFSTARLIYMPPAKKY